MWGSSPPQTDDEWAEPALVAHEQWHIHLPTAIVERTFSMIPEQVSDVQLCRAEEWLSRSRELERLHKHFHEVASEVIRLLNEGDRERAAKVFREKFIPASSELRGAILAKYPRRILRAKAGLTR